MNITEYYKILNIPETANDIAVTKAYKSLAIKYHPDKNRDKIDWANRAMSMINEAYSEIISYRFKNSKISTSDNETSPGKQTGETNNYQNIKKEEIDDDKLINLFIRYRELAKDALYQFFQYRLFNLVVRDERININKFSRIVKSLRRTFHLINNLSDKTDDEELLEHFEIFTKMILDFYRSAECLNRIESYSNQIEVDAFRLYRKGDEALHTAQKELFFERHNRGTLKNYIASENIIRAEKYFIHTLRLYPETSWAVETKIKLEYTRSLKNYFYLFFTK